MPRPDITKLIADNLGSMPHPDGNPRRFMHHSQFAGGQRNEKVQLAVRKLGEQHGECVQHLLETRGYTITHKDDPKRADAEGYKTVTIKCVCGKQLLELGVSEQMTATLSRIAAKSVAAALLGDCPHD